MSSGLSSGDPSDHSNEIEQAEAVSFRQLLLAASVIGILGGIVALAYAKILHLLMVGT